MKTSWTLALMAALCISPDAIAGAGAEAEATDPFAGIYFLVDPLTGAEQDVLKVSRVLGEYNFRFMTENPRKWSTPDKAEVVGSDHHYRHAGPISQSPDVKVLSAAHVGDLYLVPQGATSRLGRPYTGYLGDIEILGLRFALNRRPLGGTRDGQDDRPLPDERKVHVHAINYSANMVALSVTAPGRPTNAVDTDPLNPYTFGAETCCFSIPAKWRADTRVDVEYQLPPDRAIHKQTLALPEYSTPAHLWLVMHEDGKLEVVLSAQLTEYSLERPGAATWRGTLKHFPSAPKAYRQQRMAEAADAGKPEFALEPDRYWR
jgi:hypothetical protein